MQRIKFVAAMAAAVALLLGGGLWAAGGASATTRPPAAHAGAPVVPANNGDAYIFKNYAGFGQIWDRPSDGTFHSKSDNQTTLTQEACKSGGWCEWQVPNGQCMEWHGGDIIQAGCNTSIASQFWSVYSVSSAWEINNYYGDQQSNCTGGFYTAVTSNASGGYLYLTCPQAGGGGLTSQQLWLRSAA